MDRHLNLVLAFPNAKCQQRHLELERARLLDHAFSMDELKPLIHVLPGAEFVEKENESFTAEVGEIKKDAISKSGVLLFGQYSSGKRIVVADRSASVIT
jgi:hypothetical protein